MLPAPFETDCPFHALLELMKALNEGYCHEALRLRSTAIEQGWGLTAS